MSVSLRGRCRYNAQPLQTFNVSTLNNVVRGACWHAVHIYNPDVNLKHFSLTLGETDGQKVEDSCVPANDKSSLSVSHARPLGRQFGGESFRQLHSGCVSRTKRTQGPSLPAGPVCSWAPAHPPVSEPMNRKAAWTRIVLSFASNGKLPSPEGISLATPASFSLQRSPSQSSKCNLKTGDVSQASL